MKKKRFPQMKKSARKWSQIKIISAHEKKKFS